MIEGVNIDIVDVEQYAAAGLLRKLRQKIPLGDGRAGELQITGHIFNQYLAAQIVLHFTDAINHVLQRSLDIGQR